MACIRLPAMPRSTAEDALSDLWVLLEKYGLETPVLTIKFRPDDHIFLKLVIKESPTAAHICRDWARHWRQKTRSELPEEASDSGAFLAPTLISAG
jgi:hypothetical protein